MQSSSSPLLQPTIVAIAESRHYLVGAMDDSDNFVGLGQRSAEVVGSLEEARAYLRNNNIFSAQLELHTAYDEMCGQSAGGSYRQRISF